ncbi:hypothetical protein EIP91_006728 [Steccherinum ochraceum]|uniref:MIF4G domain-containing protein n=1 Tax=Steccherinum ochraceum TaxID=92696 RepID=A0A4R0RFX5_9APHY|nr:hypothetical protein EIP91_006728 [Steccherinum ochraceum]
MSSSSLTSFSSGTQLPGQTSAATAFESLRLHHSLQPDVAPLEVTANRWQASSIHSSPPAGDASSSEMIERKVRGLLNKLTMKQFDSISDQIIVWVNKCEGEKDSRILKQVIKSVLEQAEDEVMWSKMYALLCRRMMEQISQKVQDDNIRNSEGKPITGGNLFHRLLLISCQEDVDSDRDWTTEKNAETGVVEDESTAKGRHANEESKECSGFEVYYAAQRARHRGLGCIQFISELFKLQMVTERIMHEMIKRSFHNPEHPREEDIEGVCVLMTSVGSLLDVPKARAHMNVYFQRMKELLRSQTISSYRVRFMLQDVVELRERKWIPKPRSQVAEIDMATAKERIIAQKDLLNRRLGLSRGDGRGAEQIIPQTRNIPAQDLRQRPAKAGDLSQFGKLQKTTSMSFGPSDSFRKPAKSRYSTISRTNTTNAFSILHQNLERGAGSSISTMLNRDTRDDVDAEVALDAPVQRKRLNLFPRTVETYDSV